MSNSDLIIEERSRDIGDFLVGRLIPFRQKRMVGPFIFIDHMGPSTIGPNKFMDVDQHPHIGLSTLTYLFEGQINHRDSIGTNQLITPGSVNWMTAGKGITHTERTPNSLRNGGIHHVHGYQIWVALPKELEEMEPEFFHIPSDKLPKWEEGNAKFTLVAGKAFDRKSPLPVYSELFMVDLHTEDNVEIDLKEKVKGEIGICVVDGAINACDNRIEKGHMLVSKEEDVCKISVERGSKILFFGGPPFPEERHIFWNFVSSSKDRIEQAKTDWISKSFPKVEGDETYIPLPQIGRNLKTT